ncbi:MAG: ferrochelatase [Gemmatimonadaceae bacterium]
MTRGVLLMAYGTPESTADVEAYYTHIRGGRAPAFEAVEKLKQRYDVVGGRTPLLEITNAVRVGLERELNAASPLEPYQVYVGMKHWRPFVGDVIRRIAEDCVSELIALALAPHYSRISIGGYQKAVDEPVSSLGSPFPVRMVSSWHMNAGFIALIADRIRETLAQWSAADRARVVTVFSAHSLPERIRQWNDPYEQQLMASCHAVAERAGIDIWRFAWQSAGETGEHWLGPDISEVLSALHADGMRDALSVPIGFVSDNLEILYDLDHLAKGRADALGMTFRRTAMPNADPAFIRVLASVVSETAAASYDSLERVS